MWKISYISIFDVWYIFCEGWGAIKRHTQIKSLHCSFRKTKTNNIQPGPFFCYKSLKFVKKTPKIANFSLCCGYTPGPGVNMHASFDYSRNHFLGGLPIQDDQKILLAWSEFALPSLQTPFFKMAAIILAFFSILACIQARAIILVSTGMFWMPRNPMISFLSANSGYKY